MKKILLTGYYGFQNLGDDLLFICNYRLLERMYPDSTIDIFTESPNPSYLENLVGKKLQYLNSSSSGDYDIIWHGGGGVFFDFKEGDRKSLLLNHFIRWIGPRRFTKIYQWLKRKADKPVITFRQRIGMGIGVGTFTRSSVKFRSKIQQLSTFSYLIVRDEESKRNALRVCPSLKIEVASDIVFDTDLWMPVQQAVVKTEAKGNIGIVLRDWSMSSGYNYFQDVFLAAKQLKTDGYQVNFFSFDGNTDKRYIEFFELRGEKVNVWHPQTTTLSDYLQQLKMQSVIITSRFHGAVVGACLGIPGVCLNIEPKLKSAIEMLGEVYSLVDIPLEGNELISISTSENIAVSAVLCSDAVVQNKQILERSYSFLNRSN